jgi:hypothetical protein
MPQVQTNTFRPASSLLGSDSRHSHHGALQRSLRDSVASALGVDAKGRGIQGLALAIRDKLAAAGDGDAVPSVLDSIKTALDDAAARLAKQGVPQEQIDASIARFRNKLAREIGELAGSTPAEQPPTPTPVASAVSSAIAARAENRERFSLDILTAEGDRVSIRFKSVNITEVAAASVSRDGAAATVTEANVISRGRFKVEVDGDLNDAERAAIGDLLDKVDGIANEFFKGDVQAAFAAAARVGLESDALSAFDLKLSYSRSVAVAQTYASNARLGSEPKTQPKPSPAVVTPGVVNTPAPVAEAAAPVEAATTQPTENAALPTSNVSVVNPESNQPARAAIGGFVKGVLALLASVGETDSAKFSMRWKMDFLMTALDVAATKPSEKAAADVLGKALDAQVPAEA